VRTLNWFVPTRFLLIAAVNGIWPYLRRIFVRPERAVKFDASQARREMEDKLAQWKRDGWSVTPAPKERPAGNVVTLPFGGEYAANVIKKETDTCAS